MKKLLLLFLGSLLGAASGMAQEQRPAIDAKVIDRVLQSSSRQIQQLIEATPLDEFPKTFENGKHVFSGSSWWCSGFYPGTLLLLSEGTNDAKLRQAALDKLPYLEKEQYNTGTHDLGFMLYCSFGQALRLTGDSAKYLPVLEQGAASLASRFDPRVGAIRSWDHGDWEYAVIIDNMMNLEMLTAVGALTNQPDLIRMAETHARKTLNHHFREDYSSYHVVDYDEETGQVRRRGTHQGAADESAWARGQAWGLYGFTMMYRQTQDEAFLQQAEAIANYLLNHPSMPEDDIPVWDLDYQKIPAESPLYANRELRDASAAAVTCSALIELSQYASGESARDYLQAAERILNSLCSPAYLASDGENGGFLLKHSVGALPLNSEVDVPLSYADYYFVEALVRYQKMANGQPLF